MGPQSAGAVPGPVSYGQGGRLPACTDANLVLGYLNPGFFAGGTMQLDIDAARAAIKEHIADPLGMDVETAAAGMYRVTCNNMAQGVREVTIKRGFDPREFPMVVAGGAGPIHSCMICEELQIPFQIVQIFFNRYGSKWCHISTAVENRYFCKILTMTGRNNHDHINFII